MTFNLSLFDPTGKFRSGKHNLLYAQLLLVVIIFIDEYSFYVEMFPFSFGAATLLIFLLDDSFCL